MWRRASISSRTAVEFLVSVFMVLTTTDMWPHILGTVNFRLRVFRETQAQVGVRKNGGHHADSLGAISIAVVHERLLGGHPRRCPLRGRRAVWWFIGAGSGSAPVNYIREIRERGAKCLGLDCRFQFFTQQASIPNAVRDTELLVALR